MCDSSDGSTEFLKDSVPILPKDKDNDMKEFQRELINLPTFEIDTHRMDEATMPLVSRSNSVPEKLGHLHINCNGTQHSHVISFLPLSVLRMILHCLFHLCLGDTLKKIFISCSLLNSLLKCKFLCSAVPNPHDCSKRFTLYFPNRPVQSNTISTSLGCTQSCATIDV